MAMRTAVGLVKDSLKGGEQVFESLGEAIKCCEAGAPGGKCWAVLPSGEASLREVHKALADGSKELGVAVVAAEGPVSQIEVLRAMEYGGVYVAAAELDVKSVSTLQSASRFVDGPSVVLLAASSAVCNDPKWTPFTYDPRREAEDKGAFVADSDRVRREIQAFLDRENLLTLVAKKKAPAAQGEGAEGGDLADGLGDAGKTITILYSSDTGHAEECAKAVARQCRGGGYASSAVRCGPADSFDVGALPSESLVVLCIATAGKGEFCGNARGFWDKLQARADELKGNLSNTKYCVFGLGDSHYWGKGTEDSRINFAKPARDLDLFMEGLGAQRFVPTGFGDDQDVDQYHTGFAEWRSGLYSRLGVDKAAGGGDADDGPVKSDEQIKVETKQLRGSMRESFEDKTTGQLPFQDTKLVKSHGSYQQDDRDLREERSKLGIENAFSFMIRIRLPGGYCTAEQWLAMDDICGRFANGTLKITTRQTWQVHGVLKRDMKACMQAMNRACMDTVAACGDVCRNVLCTSDPSVCSRAVMDQVLSDCYVTHDHCLPRSGAYHEIFLVHGDGYEEKCQVMGSTPLEEEPLYGLTYLPRKYKIAFAVPPSNDVDVFAHCCGFIAIVEGGTKLLGYNVSVGGGLGFTHNNQKTHPRLANIIGFCAPEDCRYVAECVMTVQRDFGDRTGRKHARVKYTMEDYGPEWFREQVELRLGKKLGEPLSYTFERRGDLFNWFQTKDDDLWHCGCLVAGGRVKGDIRTGLQKIALELKGAGGFRMTCNQQLLITDVPGLKKAAVQKLLDQFRIPHNDETTVSGLRRNMIYCVALPTCPLAFAEAERYLPTLVGRLESVVERCGLRDREISIRMTGCPNSCGRPSMAEIGFIGKAPGTYNMYLGGAFDGSRLATLYKESVTEDQIIALLTPMFGQYAKERQKNETFGDFVIRAGIVKAMTAGRLWWSLPEV